MWMQKALCHEPKPSPCCLNNITRESLQHSYLRSGRFNRQPSSTTIMDRAKKNWIFILIGNVIALRLVYSFLLQQAADYPGSSRDLEFLPSDLHRANSVKPSAFDQIANEVYTHDVCNKDIVSQSHTTKEFDLESWRPFQTTGGLTDNDRKMLAKYYGSANSVFEWGLGESSYLAGHFNVSRYAGVDSEAEWVSNARDKVRHMLHTSAHILSRDTFDSCIHSSSPSQHTVPISFQTFIC